MIGRSHDGLARTLGLGRSGEKEAKGLKRLGRGEKAEGVRGNPKMKDLKFPRWGPDVLNQQSPSAKSIVLGKCEPSTAVSTVLHTSGRWVLVKVQHESGYILRLVCISTDSEPVIPTLEGSH